LIEYEDTVMHECAPCDHCGVLINEDENYDEGGGWCCVDCAEE